MCLQSHDSSLPYIAMVERCEGTQLLCRWFYRHSELPTKLRASTKPADVQQELYLSTHRDKNSRESVLGHCNVVTTFEEHTGPVKAHICRYMYDIQKNELVPIQTAQWRVHGPSSTEESSGSASACSLPRVANGIKRRRCKFPLVRNSHPLLLSLSAEPWLSKDTSCCV